MLSLPPEHIQTWETALLTIYHLNKLFGVNGISLRGSLEGKAWRALEVITALSEIHSCERHLSAIAEVLRVVCFDPMTEDSKAHAFHRVMPEFIENPLFDPISASIDECLCKTISRCLDPTTGSKNPSRSTTALSAAEYLVTLRLRERDCSPERCPILYYLMQSLISSSQGETIKIQTIEDRGEELGRLKPWMRDFLFDILSDTTALYNPLIFAPICLSIGPIEGERFLKIWNGQDGISATAVPFWIFGTTDIPLDSDGGVQLPKGWRGVSIDSEFIEAYAKSPLFSPYERVSAIIKIAYLNGSSHWPMTVDGEIVSEPSYLRLLSRKFGLSKEDLYYKLVELCLASPEFVKRRDLKPRIMGVIDGLD